MHTFSFKINQSVRRILRRPSKCVLFAKKLLREPTISSMTRCSARRTTWHIWTSAESVTKKLKEKSFGLQGLSSIQIVLTVRLATRAWSGRHFLLMIRIGSTAPIVTHASSQLSVVFAQSRLYQKKAKPKHPESEQWIRTFIPSASSVRTATWSLIPA